MTNAECQSPFNQAVLSEEMDSTALCLRWLDTEKLWFWLVKVCIRWKTQPEENGFRQLVCFQKKGRQISFDRTFTRASELWLLKFDAFLSVKCQYKLPVEKKKRNSPVVQRNTDCMKSAFVFPCQCPPNIIIIYITVIIALFLIHFVICVNGTTALGFLRSQKASPLRPHG